MVKEETDDIEDLLEKELKKKTRSKHRGYGDYEKRIYSGPDVKREYK